MEYMAPSMTTPTRHSSTGDRVQRRKIMKQNVERRRRERIQQCLDDIKSIVLKNMNKNPADYEKMEKADILEMTVCYLAELTRAKASRMVPSYPASTYQTSPPQTQAAFPHPALYSQGYTTCLRETQRYLEGANTSNGLKSRLLGHLENTHPKQATSFTAARMEVPSAFKMVQSQQSSKKRDSLESTVSSSDDSMCLDISGRESPRAVISSNDVTSNSHRNSPLHPQRPFVQPAECSDVWRPW